MTLKTLLQRNCPKASRFPEMMKNTSGVRCFLSPAPEFYVGEAVVNFSLLYELEMPKPWTPQREYHMYHEAMAQIELADQLGYHKVWEVEHHFLEEYSHSSAPEVFLSAVSQRTQNIRIGHGILSKPLASK
jgi:hypothetical protein